MLLTLSYLYSQGQVLHGSELHLPWSDYLLLSIIYMMITRFSIFQCDDNSGVHVLSPLSQCPDTWYRSDQTATCHWSSSHPPCAQNTVPSSAESCTRCPDLRLVKHLQPLSAITIIIVTYLYLATSAKYCWGVCLWCSKQTTFLGVHKGIVLVRYCSSNELTWALRYFILVTLCSIRGSKRIHAGPALACSFLCLSTRVKSSVKVSWKPLSSISMQMLWNIEFR